MNYSRIIEAVYSEPWAILPEKLAAIRQFLSIKAVGGDVSEEQIKAATGSRRGSNVQMAGRIAVMPIFGTLAQRVGSLEEASGGVSAEAIGATLEGLVADKQVRAIVMAFDSPGGSVYGIEELGAKIRALKEEKKIVGLADSVAASAAYWLISQTSEVNVTPGGQIGSIGVVAAHEDYSKHLEEKAGVKTTLVTAGTFKGEGNPYGPLTDEARAEMQKKVNHYYGLFVGAVAKGRGVTAARVEKDFGQGRMFTASEAVTRGMADHVATLEQVLRRLGAGAGGTANMAARLQLAEAES